ncbi:Zinc finger MYM-type protein 1 [Chionoecetes opilio]|uniref:Zinc finger MYM-type protein 1 n=1 Tax=Chionoecetes opilio TaxID=41210 RepID=A0A8J4YLT6_CHIOP|nr:Zinc finger MYM-type protein 1 [Chionoecetes opilio]
MHQNLRASPKPFWPTSLTTHHGMRYTRSSMWLSPTLPRQHTPHRPLLRLPLCFPCSPEMTGPRRGKQWRSSLPQGREVQLYEAMTSLQHSPPLWLFSWDHRTPRNHSKATKERSALPPGVDLKIRREPRTDAGAGTARAIVVHNKLLSGTLDSNLGSAHQDQDTFLGHGVLIKEEDTPIKEEALEIKEEELDIKQEATFTDEVEGVEGQGEKRSTSRLSPQVASVRKRPRQKKKKTRSENEPTAVFVSTGMESPSGEDDIPGVEDYDGDPPSKETEDDEELEENEAGVFEEGWEFIPDLFSAMFEHQLENSVKHLQNINFSQLTLSEKIEIKAREDLHRWYAFNSTLQAGTKNTSASLIHDETTSSEKPGVFSGLIDFACELDPSLDPHVTTATVFKGTFKVIQNELLESMLEICQNKIREEIKNAQYLSVMCDETTDVYDRTQMAIVLRYELQGKPVERFWGCFNPINQTAEALASVLLKELQTLIGDCPHKLIAQSYDGAAALSGVSPGVPTRIQEVYNNAHFIPCYAHRLSKVLEKATSQSTEVRIFFNCLSGIPAFFSKSPQRMAALESVAGCHIPRPSATRWNFESRTVNAVHAMKDALLECCSTLEASHSRDTGSAAASIKRLVNDPEFEFWLEFFSKVMPHVDILFSQLQSNTIDAAKANASLKVFNSAVQKLRDECHVKGCDAVALLSPPEQKRRKCNADKSAATKEVCDVILLQCRERFSFTNHLEASKLLLVNNFPVYAKKFPSNELEQAVAAYPMLEKDRLRTELGVLYAREDLFQSESLIDLLELMNDNMMQATFSVTVKLVKILITTPMTTAEAERCFSTLNRIKTFVRSTKVHDRLSALAVIAIENTMISEIKDFNEIVINHFATSKNRRTDFIYK